MSVAAETEIDMERMNPRSRRVRRAILDAAVGVLMTEGAENVTVSRVATRADVARTTIYRHWPDQDGLLLATIDEITSPHRPPPGVGVLDRDLRTALGMLRTRLVTHDTRLLFGALASRARHDEGFARAQRRFVEQLVRPIAAVLEAARERGETRADLDCQFEATLLAGPALHQHLMLHAKISDTLLETVVERWLSVHGLST